MPKCDGKQCGDNGCGQQCGTCDAKTELCDAGGLCQPNPRCGNDNFEPSDGDCDINASVLAPGELTPRTWTTQLCDMSCRRLRYRSCISGDNADCTGGEQCYYGTTCTTAKTGLMCKTADDCLALPGHTALCSKDGYCFIACSSDADCFKDLYCGQSSDATAPRYCIPK